MTFNLTKNETAAAMALVKECLSGMGGTRPIDLDDDPFTWVWPDVLTAAGWTRHEAAGTWSALLEKGVIYADDPPDFVLADNAYRWLDTIWGENDETAS